MKPCSDNNLVRILMVGIGTLIEWNKLSVIQEAVLGHVESAGELLKLVETS